MSIFSRIRDLLSANINAMLDAAEDPEKMAEEYLRQLNNELYEAKTSVAAAMADATKLNTKEAQYTAETEQWAKKAEAALRAGDESLAKAALARKVQAGKLAQQYKDQSDAQDQQVEQLQQALVQLESRISEVRAKKELIVAKKNRAATQEAIQRTVRGLGNINAVEADVVLTGDASCMTQMNGGLSRNQSDKRVQHVADFLASGLKTEKAKSS